MSSFKVWVVEEFRTNRQLRVYSFIGINLGFFPVWYLAGVLWGILYLLIMQVAWWVWALWAMDKYGEIFAQFEVIRYAVRKAKEQRKSSKKYYNIKGARLK